jgi:hypothetical protein
MIQHLSRGEERRGIRRVLYAGAVAAAVLGIAVFVWPLLPLERFAPPDNGVANFRTAQPAGDATAARTPPAPSTDARAVDEPALGGAGVRGRELVATASGDEDLTPEQLQAVDNFAALRAKKRVEAVGFRVAIGAAVPRQVELRELPRDLARALPYWGDQYVLLPDRLVIVERESRRIVAIVPIT